MWHGFTRTQNNVETLEQNPWDKPKRLLHIPVAWIHLVFVGIPAGVFTAVWLDTVAGFSVWADSETLRDMKPILPEASAGYATI